MLASQIPTKFQMAFGTNASGLNIRPVPVTTTDPNAASESLGWPPSTFTPSGAGGVPPDGRDMNGLDNQLSAWALWFSIGGPISYDSVQQAAIGGYPQYAIVGSVGTPGTYWQSTTDNNVTDPDASGAGWVAWPGSAAVPWSAPPPIGNSVPNTGAFTQVHVTAVITAAAAQINGSAFFQGDIDAIGHINSNADLRINGVGFAHAFGQNGYQQLPSGLIIQWGRFFASTGNGDIIVFPISFPAQATLATDAGNNGSGTLFAVNGALGAGPPYASFRAWTFSAGTITAGVGVGWIAIGS